MTYFRLDQSFPANTPLNFDDFMTRDNWHNRATVTPIQLTAMPAVNIFETHDLFFIQIVAPGLTLEDLQIECTETVLDIQYMPSGDYFEPFDTLRHWHNEYRPRPFRRRFEVNPEAIDLLSRRVTFENGILTFEMPKTEVVRGKVAPIFGFCWN